MTLSPVREDACIHWYQEFVPRFGTVRNGCTRFDCDRACHSDDYCEFTGERE